MRSAVLIFLLAVAVAGGQFFVAGETLTGHISDAKCGAAHADHSEKSIGCVKGCVSGGQKPVFVTGDKKVLQIANADKVMGHLGHKVEVTGKVMDGTLTIKSVKQLAP